MRGRRWLVIFLAVSAVFATIRVAPADLAQWRKLHFAVVGEEMVPARNMTELRALFTDPLVCSGCHPQHHAEWSRSFHAKSIVTAGFQAAYKNYLAFLGSAEAREQLGRKSTADDLRQCLFCHIPQVQFATDKLVLQISEAIAAGKWEELRGAQVSCVVCHAMTPAGAWATDSLRSHDTFFGPLMDPVPQAMHKSQFSERHTKSEFCAPCHSQQKFNVFCSLVYDQQQQVAPEKRGQCQDCHMPAKEQGAVAVGGKMDRTPHDHTFPGGRFPEMWGKALDLELQAAREGRTELAVTVTMRSKVPHHIPDG